MPNLFPRLGPKQQKGSKPRCHLLTHGSPDAVASRLTALIEPWGKVSSIDNWMPSGFEKCAEAQLHSASTLLSDRHREELRHWWLKVCDRETKTPNIDIASTCRIHGKSGLLLVEAKAHDYELQKEEAGKSLSEDCSHDSRTNHEQIGSAIESANASLSEQTKLPWSLSRNSHYQMSNRFAWAWKLTELGMPVILVYLGFIDCEEMRQGRTRNPIKNHPDWQNLVQGHSRTLFPDEVWNREWRVNGQSLIPLITTINQPLHGVG